MKSRTSGCLLADNSPTLPWHPTLSPPALAGVLLRWAFLCPTSISLLMLFFCPCFSPYPSEFPCTLWLISCSIGLKKPVQPPGPWKLPPLRFCDPDSLFPLFGTPLRKDICLAPWTVFKERDYVQVGINVQNLHLSGI